MNPTLTLATTRRVLLQLRHDPRTVALLVALPSLLMVLLRYVFDSKHTFSGIAPALLGIFPFLLMFLVTSITTLRERSSG
jgi:ABC-2 type transport system permease protein